MPTHVLSSCSGLHEKVKFSPPDGALDKEYSNRAPGCLINAFQNSDENLMTFASCNELHKH